MKKEYSLLNYFSEGFALANKSLVVFIVGLFLSIAPLILSTLFSSGSFSFISGIFSFVIIFISFGFLYSMPYFLQKQQQNALGTNVMLQVTRKNTKRIILPLLLLVILFVGTIVIFSLVMFLLFSPTQKEMSLFFQNLASGNLMGSIIGIILLAVFGYISFFSAILFSIEDKSFFRSIKEGFWLSVKNTSFVLSVIGVTILSYLLTTMIPGKQLVGQIAVSAITQYVAIIVAATTLIYYQKVIKK